MDGCDHRYRQALPDEGGTLTGAFRTPCFRQFGASAIKAASYFARHGGKAREVETRAESTTIAGEHHGSDVAGLHQALTGLGNRREHLRGQGVVLFGTIQTDICHTVLGRDGDKIGHYSSPPENAKV